MVGHLKNVALLLHTQRSRRRKNCKIGGLMFDGIYLKLNSRQSSTRERNTSSVQAPVLGKRILLADKSDNHVLYHITSQVWQMLQHGMGSQALEGQWKEYFSLSFLEEMTKMLHIVLQCIFRHDFLSPHIYYNSFGCQKLSQPQHVLLL